MVDAARGVLNELLADVYVFTDAVGGSGAGPSPGYGITLVAETTSGCLISAEAAAIAGSTGALAGSTREQQQQLVIPEDVGRAAAQQLLEEVSRGGVVDAAHQGFLLLLAALGPREMNKVCKGVFIQLLHTTSLPLRTHTPPPPTHTACPHVHMPQVRLGPLTPYAVHTLRHLKDFLQVQFSMRPDTASGTIFLSCIGSGLRNINRKVT